jgi:SAM-dependent methyltransferase
MPPNARNPEPLVHVWPDSPFVGVSDTAARYDIWHADRIRGEGSGPRAPCASHEMAVNRLGDIGGLRVLEAGCGTGEFARELVRRGAHVAAVDLSPRAVAEAKEISGAYCQVATVTDLPYPDGSFDLVVCLETLEQVPDWTRGLAELVRVTRGGGRLIVTIPNYLSLVGLYRLYLRLTGRRFTEMGQPVNKCLTTVGLWWRLRRAGLWITHVDGRVMQLRLPGGRTVFFRRLERFPWLCQHACTVAYKPVSNAPSSDHPSCDGESCAGP